MPSAYMSTEDSADDLMTPDGQIENMSKTCRKRFRQTVAERSKNDRIVAQGHSQLAHHAIEIDAELVGKAQHFSLPDVQVHR